MSRRVRIADNPWRLQPSVVKVLDALIEEGSPKRVAATLDRAVNTVEQHLMTARIRMQVEHTVLVAVLWDRFRRSQ